MTKTQVKRNSQGWISEFGPVCCGRIVEVDGNRQAHVDFPGNPREPVVARCLNTVGLPVGASLGDLPVLLVFEHGDPAKPIIVGVVQSDATTLCECDFSTSQAGNARNAVIDGRRMALEGAEEVTLICGKASITLTKDGRISLRGVEIVSRASGANKIRGASVSIN